jgi:Carboxypeptidase regulatory-like domain/TonB dependent receptor
MRRLTYVLVLLLANPPDARHAPAPCEARPRALRELNARSFNELRSVNEPRALHGRRALAPHEWRAQDLDDVTVSGRVSDERGAVVVGARVKATLRATGAAREAVTDAGGRYRLAELPPGEYTLRASSDGFADAAREGVTTLAGQSLRLDFTLRPVGVTAEQTVTADSGASALDTSRTVTGGTVSRAELERLPLHSRAPLDLVFTLPGVSEEPLSTRAAAEDRDPAARSAPARRAETPEEAGTFALSGGAAYSNNLTLDGLDNNDDRAARERFSPPADSVEEVQVITNQFSAEYGRASGGRVNLRTRSGALDLRGRLSHGFRDESLDANTFFNNARGLPRLPLQRHEAGFTLGGPLALPSARVRAQTTRRPNHTARGVDHAVRGRYLGARDEKHGGRDDNHGTHEGGDGARDDARAARDDDQDARGDGGDVTLSRRTVFFFLAYEFSGALDSALIDTLVPVERQPLFPLPPPTTLAGRRAEAGDTAPLAPAELAPHVARVPTPERRHALVARLDRNFSGAHNGALLFQLGRQRNLRQFGGGSRLADALQGRSRDTDAVAYTDNLVISPRAVNQLRAQVSRLSPAFKTLDGASSPVVLIRLDDPLPSGDPLGRSGTLIAGSSSAGASDRRESRLQLQDTLTLLRGAHTFKLGGDLQRVRSTFVDLSDASGTFTFASAAEFLAASPARFRQRFHTDSTQRNTYFGLFLQDEWRATPRLTLSAGLRYERETIIDDRDNFGPRAALAFDPFGTGKTVLRLGAGVFQNRVLLRTVDDFTLGRRRLVFDTDELRDPSTGRALTDAERRAFIAARLRFPETLKADSALVREFAAPQLDFTRRLDPALRIPESYQLNAGFERELRRGLAFEINYTFNRGAHLWREFNANAPRLPAGYSDFTAYLLSRDFPNFRDAAGARPVYGAQTAGDLVRFTLAPPAPGGTDPVRRLVEAGVAVSVFNLGSTNSTTALEAALAALAPLRPDPSRTQVEQLVSAGDSFYHGLTLEARNRLASRTGGLALAFRVGYTLSRLTDDGVVNTSSALVAGNFRRERARSLLDRRHRLAASGSLDLPRALGSLQLAAVFRLASGAPFNVSLGGADRNLDDVSNDRPSFGGDPRLIRWRAPGSPADERLAALFSLPPIGRAGDLPRNAGRGPGLFALDLSAARAFPLGRRARLRPSAEFDNLLNTTVFTFGAEFVDFRALRPDASAAERRAALDSFLAPTRTLRPRTVRLALKLDF